MASMGPCFISTESRVANVDRSPLNGLQWDRASSARRAKPAQWHGATGPSFNGTVLHQHGEPRGPSCHPLAHFASMGPCFISTESVSWHVLANASYVLQWDRASSARRAPY